MTIEKKLLQVHLAMFHQQSKVFSGQLKDLPAFFENEQEVDRVELYNANGSTVALMRYRDLKGLFSEGQPARTSVLK